MRERKPINPIFGKVKRHEPPPETSEKTPVEPPIPEPISPSIFSKIPELRTLAKQLGTRLADWSWQYPGEVNGQPREQIRRHLYNPLLTQECPHCQKSVPTYIDFARLTSGPHCTECNGHQLKPEADTYSYLVIRTWTQARTSDNQ